MILLPRSFRGRLVLLFGLLWLAAGIPTYLQVSRVHRAQLVADRRDNLQGEARAAASMISSTLAERRREIELLAQMPLYRRAAFDNPDIGASLERVLHSYAAYSWVALTDEHGVVRQSTASGLQGVDAHARPWFTGGRRGPYVSDLHETVLLAHLLKPAPGGTPARVINFAAPVLADNGQVRGVLTAHAEWQWAGEVLLRALAPNAATRGIQAFIVNARGQVLYPEGVQRAVPPAGQAGRRASFVHWADGGDFLTVSAPVAEPLPDSRLGWRVVVRQPEAIVLANVRSLQFLILLLTGGGAVAFLLLAWFGADWMSRPLRQLADVARRIQGGEENIRFPEQTGGRELQRLSVALGGMAATLLERKHALETMNRELEDKVRQRTEELLELNRALEKLAREDGLTGLPNRRAATERLLHEWAEFRRGKAGYAVLMLDIDHFKRINDRWGHAAGDEVLRRVATLLRDGLRQTDMGGRVGGEEFMLLLPMTSLPHALLVAEKMRQAVAAALVEPVGHVTISVGVAVADAADADEDAAVQRADACLYRAKENGRNQVVGPC